MENTTHDLAALNARTRGFLLLLLSLPVVFPILALGALRVGMNEGVFGVLAILLAGSLYLGGWPYFLFLLIYVPMTLKCSFRTLLAPYLASPLTFVLISLLYSAALNLAAEMTGSRIPITVPGTVTSFFLQATLESAFAFIYLTLGLAIALLTPLRHLGSQEVASLRARLPFTLAAQEH